MPGLSFGGRQMAAPETDTPLARQYGGVAFLDFAKRLTCKGIRVILEMEVLRNPQPLASCRSATISQGFPGVIVSNPPRTHFYPTVPRFGAFLFGPRASIAGIPGAGRAFYHLGSRPKGTVFGRVVPSRVVLQGIGRAVHRVVRAVGLPMISSVRVRWS